MKHKYIEAWMDMAERFSLTSEAKRLKVAAFLFKNGNVVSHSINGTPEGWETNECEDKVYFSGGGCVDLDETVYNYEDELGFYKLVTKPEVLHAEEQCLQKMWHSHETTDDCEMLVTVSPCIKCALKIKAAGIKKVYYRHNFRDLSGVDYLKKLGVEVEQI